MKLNFSNSRGDTICLTNNEYVFLVDVNGQTVANSNISSVVIGGMDGDEVNNVQAQPRTITLDLRIKSGIDVEEAKRAVLRVAKIKQNGTLEWEQNDRTVVISGIIENVEMPRWKNGVGMQISLHCEQPFWEDVENAIQEINEAISLHYFTDFPNDMLYFPAEGIAFSEYDMSRTRHIYNAGDVEVGLDIEIKAFATVTNPIIYNTDNKFFGCGYGSGAKQIVMNQGDIITISTHKGKKSVKLNGVSIIGKIKPQSTWLQLATGDNIFAINSDDDMTDNMTFTMTYKRRYI